jgi:tetratricopeptide (TPR) repeat protein
VDPIGLVRGSRTPEGFTLGQYVNDRPYAASSLLAVALGTVYSSARRGASKERPELVDVPLALEIRVPALSSRGGVELAERKLEPAMQHYRRALAIWEKTLGPDHPNVGTVRYYMGQVALAQGQVDEAVTQFGRTLAIWEKALGKDHPSLSAALDGLGAAMLARGDARGALAQFERATRLLEAAEGPDHPDLADGLTGFGLASLSLGDPRHALLALERAEKIHLASPGDPLDTARTEFGLARALVATGGDRVRAQALAAKARAAYASNDAAKKEVSAIDAWLAKQK